MARPYPAFVNKQFNSPIKLYSPQNIQETLDKQTQVLANEAVGIDFHQLAKPANLQNSAVLRMLEEEEQRKRNGHPPSVKQVVWPPPPSEGDFYTNGNGVSEETPVYNQYSTKTSPSPVNYQNQQSAVPVYNQHQIPVTNAPVNRAWSSPTQPQESQQYQPSVVPQTQYQQPQQYQPQVTQAFRPVAAPRPPPGFITLKKSPPISQAPAPIYTSQPATAILGGGGNMRGDQKWPPAAVKAQAEAENEARRALAKGPACRPRRVNKDYSSFFAQHQLNSMYPGYRAPPGTQHYTEGQQGYSNL